ncbi:MAG TPA: SagB/ThcOx family dehydrogenase [Candidatus Acidoferrales bacterium]|nr:SagB/ThcOx family dehydrogenase [Candidatus Acidoferrales bacterium]
MRKMMLAVLGIVASAALLLAQTPGAPTNLTAVALDDNVSLPAPAKTGGMTLNEALASRRSVREYATTKLTQQELSQLLWAAQGITDDKGHRTAPSAHAQYFLHIYVANSDGVFAYLPQGHELAPITKNDVRSKLSQQDAVRNAPTVFIVAGEYERAAKNMNTDAQQVANRFVDLEAGHATQNLLLEATALKLGAVPVGGLEAKQVTSAAGLPSSVRPIYLVPVGHTK